MKIIKKFKNLLFKSIRRYKFTYAVLALILSFSFFLRIYRISELLGFYYDQGRDALVIWRFWHEGKPFLVGPVTGLEGIFLGPFYYYLIAPFYLIGGGNPIYPAIFLAFLSVIAIGVVFYLGWRMQSLFTGLIAAIISGFSYYFVQAGRWLANPTPILLTSVLLLLSMWKIIEDKTEKSETFWFSVAILVGISLQLEAASAIFYIPMVIIFIVYLVLLRKKLFSFKTFIFSTLILLLTLLPQIIFNFRHENILLDNFSKVIFEEKSFKNPFTSYNLIKKRDYFWNVFSSKIFPREIKYSGVYYLLGLLGIFLTLKKNSKAIIILSIFIGIPLIGYIFFQGNYGNIYDYYMTGYYLPAVLLFSIGLGYFWKNLLGKILVLLFLVVFLNVNIPLIKNYISAGTDGPTHITLGNELDAVNWVFDDASELDKFNIDVYVPPVIPHSYEYLFLWQGNVRCGKSLCNWEKNKQENVVYVLFEIDPPHPERLENWLSRYEENSILEKEVKFGGVTVQRRLRI